MKSDRLTRKTAARRHSRPTDAVTVYDLTQGAYDNSPLSFRSLGPLSSRADGAIAKPVFGAAADVLRWCAALCAQSPTAARLWNAAGNGGWSIALGDLKTGGFCMDTQEKTVTLDHFALAPAALGRSGFFRNALICTLIRALRDIGHEDPLSAQAGAYGPEDVLMMERIRAADCDTVATLVAWEWRGAGHADIWRHLIGSEEGDMALVFSRVLEHDPSSLFDGSALAYAFRQWYVDDARVNAVDHETLESLDEAMGEGCGATASPFGTERLTGGMIEALSTLPDGNRYLAGLGKTVGNDPFFSGLDDEINQVHLFHLIYDSQVVMVNNVPFRDAALARLIFPEDRPVVKQP